MNARKYFAIGVLLPGLALQSAFGMFSEDVRQALRLALEDTGTALKESALPANQTISLLPFQGDRGHYVEGLLKNAVTGAGLTYVEGKSDPFWDELLKEIEWDERKEDILDAATLTRFGKLKGTQLLMYGTVREASDTNGRVYVEIEAHISSIETKQHLWGRIFAKRYPHRDGVQGIIDLDKAVRGLLKEALRPVPDSLANNPKLKDIRSVAIVPLSGDIDDYVTGLVQDALSRTSLYPKDLDLTTLAEARLLLRGEPDQADALLYGAVRDLSRELDQEKFTETVYTLHAEVQLRIQDVSSGEILWSDTLAEEALDSDQQPEVTDRLWVYFRERPVAGIALGIVVVLAIGGRRLFKMAQRRPPR